MRKFILNFSVLSALLSAIGLARTTTTHPRDWRLILLWVGWGLNVAIAIGTAVERSKDQELEEW